MSENTPNGKVAGIRKAWADPKARKGLLLAGGVIALVATISFTMMNKQSKTTGAPASAKVVAPPTTRDDVMAKTPEVYKQMVRDVDQQRSADAAASSPTSMVLPRVTGLTDPETAQREEERRLAAAKAAQTQAQKVAEQVAAQSTPQGVRTVGQQVDPDQQARSTAAYRATQSYLAATAVQMTAPTGGWMPVLAPQSKEAQAAGGTAAGTQPGVGGVAVPMGPPLIRAGEVLFATSDLAVNSDHSGPVLLTIRQGKFAGSRLIGQKALERDAVVMRFSTMSPAEGGPSIPVQAFAVSIGDAKKFGLTGIEGEKDYHYMERYVLPAAISFVQTYGLASAVKGQTAVASAGGVGTTTPELTAKDRAMVALGGAMTPILADVSKAAIRPITISMDAGMELGILFAADVFTTAQIQPAAQPVTTQGKQSNPDLPVMTAPRAQSGSMAQSQAAQNVPGMPNYNPALAFPAYKAVQ